MKLMNLKTIAVPLILTVLISAAFWLYTEWDIKRFKESLPNPPPAVETPRETTTTTRPAEIRQEVRQNAETVFPVLDTELEKSESVATEQHLDTAVVEEVSTGTTDLDSFFDMFLEETAANAVTSGDFTDVSQEQEVPYDMAVVKSGFDDYNAFLETDPEYAYKRLSDAFREQYGDVPDVDRLVEHIKQSNEAPTTFDSAIDFTETVIRLVSKIGPPEALESLKVHLELLREHQHLALEQGADPKYRSTIHVGE